MPDLNKQTPPEDPLRPHSYDGIREYDKRLPNWWLFTLYGTIVFSLFYWMYFHFSGVGSDDRENLARELAAIDAAKQASQLGNLTDDQLAAMSRDPAVVAAGQATFSTYCVSCHLPSLRGKSENPVAVGPNLIDDEWLHGGMPSDIRNTITNGVVEKGMLAWGPILGERKIVELVAFVLSKNESPPGGDGSAGEAK